MSLPLVRGADPAAFPEQARADFLAIPCESSDDRPEGITVDNAIFKAL